MSRVFLPLLLCATLALPGAALADKKDGLDFTVRDLSGKYVRLSDYKDKVVEIAFWATFCKACCKKLKYLEKWYKKYKGQDFVVLGVSVDGPETQAKVKPVVRSYKLTFPVVVDEEATVSKLFNPKRATPFSVFIKGGKKVGVREGFQSSDVEGMEKELQKLLAK